MTNQCGGANTFTKEDMVSFLPGDNSNSYIFDLHRKKAAAQEKGSDDLHVKTKGASLDCEIEKRRVRERIAAIEDERRLAQSLELDFI